MTEIKRFHESRQISVGRQPRSNPFFRRVNSVTVLRIQTERVKNPRVSFPAVTRKEKKNERNNKRQKRRDPKRLFVITTKPVAKSSTDSYGESSRSLQIINESSIRETRIFEGKSSIPREKKKKKKEKSAYNPGRGTARGRKEGRVAKNSRGIARANHFFFFFSSSSSVAIRAP